MSARQRRRATPAYLAYAALGARREFAGKATLAARMLFVAVILLVFSRVWAAVLERGLLAGRTRADLVWYIVITELVMLSFPYLHLEVEADLRSGDLVARLPQPVPYAAARLAESAGGMAVRLALLTPMALTCGAVFGAGVPGDLRGVVVALVLVFPAACLAVLSSAAIGLSAIWLHDASPVYWIWQKLAFALGGLLLPLEVYPHWLAAAARWTPFAAMLNGPGRMVFGLDGGDAARVAGQLLFWNLAGAVFVAWLWGRALRAIETSGG